MIFEQAPAPDPNYWTQYKSKEDEDQAEAAMAGADEQAGPRDFSTEDQVLLAELAAMPRPAYEHARVAAAKKLGWRAFVLDRIVESLRPKTAKKDAIEELFPPTTPWPEPVNGSELLLDMRKFLDRHVVAGDEEKDGAVLWSLMTHVYDAFDVCPLLRLSSAVKRSGKTTLLLGVELLVHRPFIVTSISAAALSRLIELYKPTLLVDEADNAMKNNDDLAAVINGGHMRRTAKRVITEGDNHDLKAFSLWAPKLLAGIGKMKDTMEDRAIQIVMKRKPSSRKVERLLSRMSREDLRSKATRWAVDNLEELKRAPLPSFPSALNDRQCNNWTGIFTIVDLIGGEWPARARQAACTLSGDEQAGIAELMLKDIKGIFETPKTDRITSADLAKRLAEFEGRPWAEWGEKEQPISPNQIARFLKRFSISPDSIKLPNNTTLKGYLLEQFEDAFCRYLSSDPPENPVSKRNHGTSVDSVGESSLSQNGTDFSGSVSRNAVSANTGAAGSVVPVQDADSAPTDAFEGEEVPPFEIPPEPEQADFIEPHEAPKRRHWPD